MSIRITPTGIVLLVVLVAALVTAIVGNSAVAAAVAGVLLLIIFGGSLQGGRGGWRTKTLAERRAEFHPTDRRDELAPPIDTEAEDELWRKERERYRQSDPAP